MCICLYCVKILNSVGLSQQEMTSCVQAINCCLSDVIPVDGVSWTDACTNRFISLANQKLVTIIATGTVN